MDKLYLDFDEEGLLTMYIEGDIDRFKSALKYANGKYIFGVEKRIIEDEVLIDKLKYEHTSLMPKVDTINSKKKNEIKSTNEEKYEVCDLGDDITFDGKNFYKIVPLEWKDNGKDFTCVNTSYTRSTVMDMSKIAVFNYALPNVYLNDAILPEIFEVKTVDRIDSYEATCRVFNGVLDKIELPEHARKMFINYENGKIVLERPTTLIKINVPTSASKVKCEYIFDYRRNYFLYDIYIPDSVKHIDFLGDFYYDKINSIVFDKNFNGKVEKGAIASYEPINSLQIPCNMELVKNIISFGYVKFKYIFDKNSKLTVTYKNVDELLNFLKRFNSLDRKLDSKLSRRHVIDPDNDLINYVPGIKFKFDDETWEYTFLNFFKDVSLKNIDITVCGPELSHGVQNKIKGMLNNDKVHFVNDELEKTKKQEQTEDIKEVNKTTLIADDMVDEILSIDYFGLDKNDVKNKANEILIKYNEDLANLKEGLSLQSEEGLYTNLLLKLNELKDNLYQKFEKNLVVYDMLDEVNILLSIINGEEVVINSPLENDFYSLSKNILPFVDEKITNDLKSYFENEKYKLENYLLTNENRPYEDMDKFILSIRTYLNVTLLSIRNYLSKEEILDVIKDYTNMQMQINYKEPIKNYLSIVLLEIDKIKNEIFDINPTNLEVHNIIDKINIDYSNMESNEIIKYVDSILMEIYGLYYKIKFNNTSKLKKESYKMRLLK